MASEPYRASDDRSGAVYGRMLVANLREPEDHERATSCNGCNAPVTHHVLEIGSRPTYSEHGATATQFRMCGECLRQVRAALATAPQGEPEPRRGYTLDYDAEYRWLVMSDPEGASEIVARDVRPDDAAYLIAGYEKLAAYDQGETPGQEARDGE